MAGSQQLRIDKAAEALVMTDDRRRYESLKREYYNLQRVSTESLVVSLFGFLGGFEPPAWAMDEFDAPIPSDAPFRLVKEAMSQAKSIMRLDECAVEPDPQFCQDIDDAVAQSLDDLSQFVGTQFRALGDVKRWCEGDGEDYRPRH